QSRDQWSRGIRNRDHWSRLWELMLQNKFVAVEHGPEHVLQGRAGVAFAGTEQLVGHADLAIRGPAGQGCVVKILDLVGGAHAAGRDHVQEAALLGIDRLLYQVAVE